MSWGYVAVGGAILVSGYMSSEASKEAAGTAGDAQSEAARMGIAEQRRQFDEMQRLLSPYTTAGAGQVGGEFDAEQYLRDNPDVAGDPYFSSNPLAHYNEHGREEGRAFPVTEAKSGSLQSQQNLLGLNGPEAQQGAISELEQSPQFQSLTRQGEEAILSGASATGGLRGGNVQKSLAQFRPDVLSQLIQQQLSGLRGITQLGQASATGQAGFGQATSSGIAAGYNQIGAARAGGAIASGQASSDFYSAIPGTVSLLSQGLQSGGSSTAAPDQQWV